MRKRTILLCLIALIGFSSASLSWTISKELQQEVKEKKAAVQNNPQSAEALFDLAITYAYTNNILEGLDTLKKVSQLDPNYKHQGLKTYFQKVTEQPSNWKLRFRLAFAYYFNGQKLEAIRELKNVLVIDPYNVWAYGYISLIYGEMGETDKAMQAARAGLKIDDLVAALHLLLAEGYYRKNDSWSGFWERATALRLKAEGY
jgi:tetratricopeptide (TPR) repeat protein